jgi:hypothetical protein
MRGAFVRLAGAQRGSAYSNVQYLCTSSSSAISTCTSIYSRSHTATICALCVQAAVHQSHCSCMLTASPIPSGFKCGGAADGTTFVVRCSTMQVRRSVAIRIFLAPVQDPHTVAAEAMAALRKLDCCLLIHADWAVFSAVRWAENVQVFTKSHITVQATPFQSNDHAVILVTAQNVVGAANRLASMTTTSKVVLGPAFLVTGALPHAPPVFAQAAIPCCRMKRLP